MRNLILHKISYTTLENENTPTRIKPILNESFKIISNHCPIVLLGSQPGSIWINPDMDFEEINPLGIHYLDFTKVKIKR